MLITKPTPARDPQSGRSPGLEAAHLPTQPVVAFALDTRGTNPCLVSLGKIPRIGRCGLPVRLDFGGGSL